MKNNLKVKRAILNITQAQLSELVGVSRQAINAIEKGKYVPSTLLSLKLAKVFDTEVGDIFELEKGDF